MISDGDDFERQYLCERPYMAPALKRAIELWAWYYVTTEDFDRKVCRFDMGGIAHPTTFDEQRSCAEHARKQLSNIEYAASCEGVTSKTFEKAKQSLLESKKQGTSWIRWLREVAAPPKEFLFRLR